MREMRKDESLPWGHQSLEQIVAGGHGRWVTDDTGKRVVEITGPPVGRLERLQCILRSYGQEPCEHTLRLWERVNPHTWPDPRKAVPFCNNRMDEDIICTIVFDKDRVKHPFVERRINLWRSLDMKDRLIDLKRALNKKNPDRDRFFPHILIHIGFRSLTGNHRFVRKDAYHQLLTCFGIRHIDTIIQKLWLPWNKYISPFHQGRMPKDSKFDDEKIYILFTFLKETQGISDKDAYGIIAKEAGLSERTIRKKISIGRHKPKQRKGCWKRNQKRKKLEKKLDELDQKMDEARSRVAGADLREQKRLVADQILRLEGQADQT